MAEPRRRDWPGIAGSLLAIAIGVAAIAASGDFSALGAVFPRTIAGLMIVLALLYVVLAHRSAAPAAVHPAGSTARRAGTAVVMLAWALLLAPVGFLFTSVCACVALLLLAQHERWSARTGVLYGLATTLVLAGLYSLFRFVLQVPLPVGLFW